MYKFSCILGFFFSMFIGTAGLCLAVEDMPIDTEHYFVIVEDNELYQNSLVGIRIRGDTPVSIKRCQIYSNGRAGITIDREARVTVIGCNVFKNVRGGINIGEAAATSIENSTTHGEKAGGERISRSGKSERKPSEVKIVNNRIYMNDEGGIRSIPKRDSEVELSVVANEIFQNEKGGIRVANNTKLTAQGNNIYDNGTLGIVSLESVIPPRLDIYQNGVTFNGGPGIHIVNGITGNIGIRNNWVYNNLRSGIACGLVGDPGKKLLNLEIINNTVVSNGSAGQGAGIRNDSEGKVTIMNNIIAYNFVAGIMTEGCREYSYNLLFANGNVGAVSQDAVITSDTRETLQYAGCLDKGKGDLIGDPLFVDPDNYNFLLQDESPAIDAGNRTSMYNDVLFPPSKGTDRNDMGATGGPYATDK